jgi:signal transduction histidine kinase
MSAPGSILAALEKLVLEHRSDGSFVVSDEPPQWLRRIGLDTARRGEPLDVERLPFLEAFVPEAQAAWTGPGARVDSGLWTEMTADGEELHLEATALRVGEAEVLVITRDDTLYFERRHVLQRARELSLAHDALSREIERKDVLIHCIVHDLAGPLNSILGVLSLLEEQALPGPGADLVRVALNASLRQRELIRDILEVFAAERSARDLVHEDAATAPDLCAEAVQIADALRPMASSRGVIFPPPSRVTAGRVRPVLPEGPPCKVVGEERRLARVLYNLFENALRFTPKGKSVQVLLHDEPGTVRLVVEDEGPGVPPAVAAHLFQKLARGRDPAAGTGLGLYFCRITVESWGGAIGYEARPEGGSRFWVVLRRAGEVRSRGDPVGGSGDGQALGRGR